ncbi:MAG TPA: DnaJ domain-containing protein [Stellaceae bacterium]|nr:DnaJ domain-containing protein [Stellaceae bacterium]
MLYFLIGSALLVLLLVLGRAFVAADPATLSRLWRPTAFTAALLLGLALSVANLRLLPVAFGVILIPLLILRRTSPPASAPGGSSEVETRYLRMRLDHASGAMSGVVREGTLSGRRLEELTLEDLIALWRECRLGDEPSADLLEAYLDRTHRDWRKARPSSAPMSREEALQVLGLGPDADESAIKAAYQAMMRKFHPDQGGSSYLAAKINQAREVLLGN